MQQEFLDLYERELNALYDRAAAFAAEFPGLADRLGGLTRDRLDPGLAGLLEGSAFLAARVGMKQNEEFGTFTTAILKQLLPGYLAPVPAAALLQAAPDFRQPDLAQGKRFAPGGYLDAAYRERDQRVSCRFRLAAPLELWPLELDQAAYFTSPAPLQALGLEVSQGTVAGLRLRLVRRTGPGTPDPDADIVPNAKPPPPVGDLARAGLDNLPVHLHGPMAAMTGLYEQIFARSTKLTLRWLDTQGDPVFARCPPGLVRQLGFDEDESFFPEEGRLFRGFALLREFHMLPQKFLGFRLSGLAALLERVTAPACDLLFEFDRADAALASTISDQSFRLYTAPAINLFSERSARVKIDAGRREHLMVPQPSPHENYEIHSVLRVRAHYGGKRKPVPIWPVYGQPRDATRASEELYYDIRQRPRRLSATEIRRGQHGDYTGSETLITLHEPATIDDPDPVQSLQADLLCTNRHLPAMLPMGQAKADFRLVNDTSIAFACITGPTPPRDALSGQEGPNPRIGDQGARMWQAINCLSFNLLGLNDRHADDPAAGLRDALSLFADLSDSITERQVQGLTGSETRPVVRSVKRPDGYAPARGLEVTLTFDERAFEGSGIALLGAVLDRFLADYVQLNSFTETVIVSRKRGEVMRWPPRSGTGPVL
ncbi:type VI secretion system baseplate subunit TssF [Salibaculum sp.]|uniref:type VI secretion system baseplate subunit TssF n=1 Tax=Salibaculum sp. TaxID=2855480 RepID=UPI002B478EF5|nr:type VI secretion system baseplate subunit TssF [Salibaculum sp.]HKL69629.1 type VI secretion system baseplate subunit TssF [Salibaculum sp.]